ncbi:MNIO family bufferin maturase [Sphingomonas sp. RB1R13]|uniref:MNIO family bufferin maturase n=1 Tax=Sphingomonas sp. RB1R13 TaxID=3096159 RepID=UPI002FCACF00
MHLPAFGGFGLGMRKPHYPDFIEGQIDVDFVEVISENFMVDGGQPRRILREVREHYPVALHGVSMSVGSAKPVDHAYLLRLRALVDEIDPLFVSDHLCWTGIDGFNSHDLLPLPYDEETLDIVAANVGRAQNTIGRMMLIENPSSYIAFGHSTMTEWEFLDRLCAKSGCGLLLDVNNVFVSASNHGFCALAYLDGVPAHHVRQVHLAGHSQGEALLIDTHDQPVCASVWDLYAHLIGRLGPISTMIERDDDIPPIADLLGELDMARSLAAQSLRGAA